MSNSDTDDTFHNDQCTNGFWQSSHSSVFFQERGSILLAAGRFFAFICILYLHRRNRQLLRSKTEDNMNVIPGLILPYYFSLIYLYICLSLLAGILDLVIGTLAVNYRQSIYNWVIPFEQAIFHWFYEGVAIFLMRYGAGLKAIKRSLQISGVWAICTFVFYFIIYCALRRTYHIHYNKDVGYALVLSYNTFLLLCYTTVRVVPKRYLYRRSALNYYSSWNMLFYSVCIIIASIAYYCDSNVICPASLSSFIYTAFVQPFVLFKTLQIDSQYWQGLKPGKDNPLAEVWDHVDVETAQSMAEEIERIKKIKMPVSPGRQSLPPSSSPLS
ncbi:hypothetical protein EON65_08645, partial [archaeon]